MKLPDSTDKAKNIYWSIWIKILWSKFLERFTSETQGTSSESIDKFNKALKGLQAGREAGLLELASYLNCKVPPFADGLCNDWRNISFSELQDLMIERKGEQKELSNNLRIMSLEIKSLVMGYELKEGAKGALLVYLYDEGKGSQLSESCKIPFTTDKLGRIPKLPQLMFKDMKQTTIRSNVYLSFRVLLGVPINEQKKTTTPIYKLAYWGCLNLYEETKTMGNQLTISSNLTLIPFHAGDKTNFSSKRYSRLQQLSKQQFLTYKICWVPQEVGHQTSRICLTNIGEIFRTPPLVESKLYLTLQSGWFEKGKKKSEKNIEVLVSIVNEKDELMDKVICEGRERKSHFRSSVARHCNTPHWDEMMTIVMPDSAFNECFVKFECTHVTSSELPQKTCLKWISYLPLATQVGNVIPNAKYNLKVLPKNTYMSKDLWEDDVLIKDEHAQAAKYTQRLAVLTQLDSTSLTDTAAIYRIKSWNMHSKDLKGILEDLHRTDFSKCVDHCQQIFTSILEIIDSCVDGEIVARAMMVLFSFNKFWNTNDDFKGRLLDSLDRITFVSGLLKIVTWIKLIIRDQDASQFNQTIKSLSLLLTIMGKSFVNIKRTRIMTDIELDRYKVVLANMLVDISNTKVGSNVMLCSQIIKVFPESLRVLHSDGIITNSEFSFHMISLMKGPILASLKDSDKNRTSYIDFIQCLVVSDFMKHKDLQKRYFCDLTNALKIEEDYTPTEVLKLGSILVRLSEITLEVINQQSMFSENITELIEAYIKFIASNSNTLHGTKERLTFLSLMSSLCEIILAPKANGVLSERELGYFEDTVRLAKRVIRIQNKSDEPKTDLGAKQIDIAFLCKRLELASKILSYCAAIEKMDLVSDMTFVATTLLAEPIPIIDQDNAPNIIIVSRIQSLQEKLHSLVERNLDLLLSTGSLDCELINPIVAMGSLKSNLKWLINFVDKFLGVFPDRLREVLLSLHVHKNNLTRNDYMMLEEAQNLPKMVKKQIKLLRSLTSISEKSHTFAIENVESLVSLIDFYSKHQCWAPFKETVNIYQDLLIKSNAFLEAAELTEYCCELLPEDLASEKEEELFTAASHYTEAGLWSRSLEVFKTLHTKYEKIRTKEGFLKLSIIASRCSELYSNLAEKPVIPFHYFLVGFYGKEVNKSFQNKLFIFRGNPLESIMDFTKRISINFPQYQQINSAKIPKTEEISQYLKAFQVIKVNPISKLSETTQCNSKFKKFSFELCSVKDKTIQNELLRMNYQRFTFEINTPLPSYRPFCELASMKTVTISPIEMAIEQMKKKSCELLQESEKFDFGAGNINQFQMMLNGTIDAAVNGGTAKLQETFLDGNFETTNPEFTELCSILRDEINHQRQVVSRCLLVHDRVCPSDLRMLHEKMVRQHENKEIQEVAVNEESMTDQGLSITPQRNALLSEIARRGSKLKKSTKMNKVKSVFFESQSKRPFVQVAQENKDAIDKTNEKGSRKSIIDAEEFHKTYSCLCTELNHDFNLHMLPRYSIGRRETLSKPLITDMKKVKLARRETAQRYSSRKEIGGDTVQLTEPPQLPPKKRKSDNALIESKSHNVTSNHQQSPDLELEIDSMQTQASEDADAEKVLCLPDPSLDTMTDTAPTWDVPTEVSLLTRCHTIERSRDIQLPTARVLKSVKEPGAATTDTLQLDLKSLATSFSLSPEESQTRRKISKTDFENKIRRNLSLNEMKNGEPE